MAKAKDERANSTMGKDRPQYKLSKIVYFDEESVTDYVQIIAGGQLTQTTELLKSTGNEGSAYTEASAAVSIGKLFRSLIGIDASASIGADAKVKFNNDKLVRNILQNTILTDFLSIANDKYITNDGVSGIRLFEDYKIEVVEDSLSYIIMVSPYMTMLKDSSAINQKSKVDYDIAIDKIDSAIRLAKGYFEFIGYKKDERKVIVRFNIDGFKNNYKISDLLKMDLIMFAVKVGKTTEEKMAIVEELVASNPKRKSIIDNPVFGEDEIQDPEDIDNELCVYDVLLAGVKEQ